MTRIWFDVLTPKQALFCHKIAEQIETANIEVMYTTRDYSEVIGKLEILGIRAEIVGRHGGAGLYEKLLASAERVVGLTKYLHKFLADLSFAFASPESARVAFGLGIPYFTANDSPHSHYVAKLTIPYAITLFTPWIMKNAWQKLEIPINKIRPYHGLDPVAWLKDFTPDYSVLSDFGLEPETGFVVIRPEEVQASYLHGIGTEEDSVINPVIKRISETFPDLPIIVLCRYPNQRKAMQRQFGSKIILPEGVVDAPSLISSALLLVGAGGTMNQEASLLGVPVISCYPGNQLETERYLIREQLLYRLVEPEDAANKAVEILKNRTKYLRTHRVRAKKLMQQMENPAEIIASHLMTFIEEKLEKK